MIEPSRNKNAGDGSESGLRIKISELERELRGEKDSLILLQSQTEVSKFVSRQEVEKCRRDCSSLEDRVLRLEEDCKTLKEREVRDRERIKSLLDEIETKEREFKEKFIELKVEIRDLECGKKRALDEVDDWKKKCGELEAEVFRLKGKEVVVTGVDEEMPKKSSKEDFVLTPEQKRSGDLVVSDTESDDREDEDDRIPLRQYKRKRFTEVANGAKKAASGASLNRSPSCGDPCEAGNTSEKGTCANEADMQIPSLPENGTQEDLEISRISKSLLEVAKSKHKLLTRNRSPRSKKKFKSFILRCSSTARTFASDCDGVAADLVHQSYRQRNSMNKKRQREYTGRVASSEQQHHTLTRAEDFQRNLNSNHPSFVRSVLRSHVSSCFWLGFPPKFSEENFPAYDQLRMVLEDEKGLEHKVNYVGTRGGGLCGGWRGFASGHNLEVGDALIFELIEPTRFKVYIIRANQEPLEDPIKANQEPNEDLEDKTAEENTDGIIKQSNTSRIVPRSRPLRFRFVRRSLQKLDTQSKQEGHV